MSLISQPFNLINLSDTFFDSLKQDYAEFETWFQRKAHEGALAYVFYSDQGSIEGFLYLKREDDAVMDVVPALPAMPRVKVGTFKINAHGTRLGERFVKKIFDHAVENDLREIYVTIFEKHSGLLSLLLRYGFSRVAQKETPNGTESVLLKRISLESLSPLQNYPVLDLRTKKCFLLPIHPEFHTRLLPDSILNNENMSIVHDVSHTNSIHKVYLTAMHGAARLTQGDNLLIYRTGDGVSPARFRAVVTSICVVEEVRHISEFSTYEEFHRYCSSYSVFSEAELRQFFQTRRYPYIIRFSYNVAMIRRINRGHLLDNFGFRDGVRWGVDPIGPVTMKNVMLQGGVNESLIVD